jgi:hypothetical protein
LSLSGAEVVNGDTSIRMKRHDLLEASKGTAVAADLDADNGDAVTTHTWEWWYRFALEVLGLAETEAREYADRRSLEDANRERIATRRAA